MEYTVNSAEWHYFEMLKQLGIDTGKEGLLNTPKRHVKMLKEMLSQTPFEFTCFDAEDIDEMIVVKDIQFYSLCEHHIVPFFGTATVAYIPSGKIVGLSKLPRTVQYYAAGLQNQERITTNIANRIFHELDPIGVGVTLRAKHLCMCMRGVKSEGSETITTKLLGVIKTDLTARSEYLKQV